MCTYIHCDVTEYKEKGNKNTSEVHDLYVPMGGWGGGGAGCVCVCVCVCVCCGGGVAGRVGVGGLITVKCRLHFLPSFFFGGGGGEGGGSK